MTKKPISQIRKGDQVRLPSGAIVTAAEDAQHVVVESYQFPVAGRRPVDMVEGAPDDEVELVDDEPWPEELNLEQ